MKNRRVQGIGADRRGGVQAFQFQDIQGIRKFDRHMPRRTVTMDEDQDALVKIRTEVSIYLLIGTQCDIIAVAQGGMRAPK
ncbi:MAG: hypothetical protein U5N26_11355 [Candidatus Marinimicrobia bacterium]|nr:hypothetical protein [Candidatus Neomarinimicrobiota bacterium]